MSSGMNNLLPIAKNTFKELTRKKLYQLLLSFVLILIGSSRLFSFFTLGEELKIIKDIGLASISLFGLLLVLVSGSTQIADEVEKKTIYLLLGNPVRRAEFILGKFLGIISVLLLTAATMTIIFYAVIYLKESAIDLNLLKAVALIIAQLMVLGSIALALSTVIPSNLNIIICIAVYVVGHMTNLLLPLMDKSNLFFSLILKGIYVVLPNFENFNVADLLVLGRPVSMAYVGICLVYGLTYTLIMLLTAQLLFQKKEV